MEFSLVILALLSSPSFAEMYQCPEGLVLPTLKPGQTVQQPGQIRCKKASGFTSFRCPGANQITSTYYNTPNEANRNSMAGYATFYNCLDGKTSVKHTIANGENVLVCGPPQPGDDPPGCCHPVSSNGAVNVEGPGFTKSGKLLDNDGSLSENPCPKIFGDLTTVSGGSHKCLVPFITVACDTDIYSFGTIFKVSFLKDVVISMPPDGKQKMRHPGYVICEDTGSAIKGPGRFDFYSGTYGDRDKNNIFSSASIGDKKLRLETKDCRDDKSYTVIKHSDPEWASAYAQIKAATAPGFSGSTESRWYTTEGAVQ